MPEPVVDVLRWYAVLGSAIMSGIFFAFSVFMLQSFNRLGPSQAISAMQAINSGIGTPLFGLAFGGTALVVLILGGASIFDLGNRSAVVALTGSVLFLLGSLMITIAFNIPLNNTLDALDPNSSSAAANWSSFVDNWLSWNHARTVLTLASTVFFILAIRDSAGS
ncbi:MAG: anthrone oxygenase family protein [Thermomicrobiales bacterium]